MMTTGQDKNHIASIKKKKSIREHPNQTSEKEDYEKLCCVWILQQRAESILRSLSSNSGNSLLVKFSNTELRLNLQMNCNN